MVGYIEIQNFQSLHMMATCPTVSQIFNHTSNEIQDLWSMCQREIFYDFMMCTSWVISMLHHWMPKRMDPSEGSPFSRNTPEVPWWVRGTWNEPLTNLLHNSRDMNNMMRRRCDRVVVGWDGKYTREHVWYVMVSGDLILQMVVSMTISFKKMVFSSLVDTSWFDMTISLVYIDIHGKKLGVSNKTMNSNFEEFMDFMLEGLHDDLNRRGRSLTSKGTNWPS